MLNYDCQNADLYWLKASSRTFNTQHWTLFSKSTQYKSFNISFHRHSPHPNQTESFRAISKITPMFIYLNGMTINSSFCSVKIHKNPIQIHFLLRYSSFSLFKLLTQVRAFKGDQNIPIYFYSLKNLF